MRDFIIQEDRLTEKERRNLSILDTIRRGRQISRADISKATDLNIVTVSNYVSKYIKDKLVFETGLDISTGGRRPELLELNSQYAYSIGIDLGAPELTLDSGIVGVLMDVSGKVIAKERIGKEKESFDSITSKVISIIDTLVSKSGIKASEIKGVGVGIWGVIDRYRGMVRYAVEDEEIVSYANLTAQIEERFDIPATIEHDATLAAFGERWSGIGAGSTSENIIFMCSDSSCGIIIKGEVYYGATKSAGELNINPPQSPETDSDKCWATYSHGCCLRSRGIDLGITRRAVDYAKENPEECEALINSAGGEADEINFELITKAAESGDQFSRSVIEEAGDYLGVKIAFMINLFNPEVVIIGRGAEKAGDIFFSSVRKSVRKWAYEESVKVVKILPTTLGDDVVACGAAGLIIQDFFTRV